MVMLYRKDYLAGYNITDPKKIAALKSAGYTENKAEAEAASKTPGGQNYTGPTTSSTDTTASAVSSTKLTQAAKDRISKSAKTKFGNLLTPTMLELYVDTYINSGNDADEAMAIVRQSPEYQNIYAGNLNADGATVKYTEAEYSQNIEAFGRKLSAIGIKPEFMLTTERKKQLTENVVSPDEFGTRVNAVYTSVLNAIPQVKEFYQRSFGRTLTDEEIIASAIDPNVGQGIISGTISSRDVVSANITRAQIGGEALLAGTDITADVAEELRKLGLSVERARAGFARVRDIQRQAQAQGRTVMSVQDIIEGTELGQMEEIKAVQNIIRQQEARSAAVIGAQTTQAGAVTGLVEA